MILQLVVHECIWKEIRRLSLSLCRVPAWAGGVCSVGKSDSRHHTSHCHSVLAGLHLPSTSTSGELKAHLIHWRKEGICPHDSDQGR